jgi:hypothetical protein
VANKPLERRKVIAMTASNPYAHVIQWGHQGRFSKKGGSKMADVTPETL